MSVVRHAFDAAFLHAQKYDWTALVALAIASSLIVTYIVTSMAAILAMKSTRNGKRPPILPYWLPFLGSIVAYFSNGPRVATNLMYV